MNEAKETRVCDGRPSGGITTVRRKHATTGDLAQFLRAGLLAWLVAAAGCQLAVNPFEDEFAGQPRVTTPSVDGVLAAGKTAVIFTRPMEPSECVPQDGTVLHTPLYFEDPYEVNGSDDGQFAWTGQDYWQWVYWRARFLLNAVLFPVSAVVTPPGTVMASDGRPGPRAFGERHDAQRSE